MVKWEFKTVHIPIQESFVDDAEVDKRIAPVGKEGWDLVQVTPILKDGATCSLVYHFRRETEQNRSVGFQA